MLCLLPTSLPAWCAALLQLLLADFLLLAQPREWLNDELVNYFVLLLQVQWAQPAAPAAAVACVVFVLGTHCCQTLQQRLC
jgi:Ulp1 family protease